jgi:hypothetical protein
MTSYFPELLAQARSSAVHLETRDQYMEDDPDLRAWRSGRRPDPQDRTSWWRDWLDLPAEATARGVVMRRARVVSEPLSEYIRYEYDGTFTNVAAGEDVRWLPRHSAGALMLPANDFWVFDSQVVLFNYFAGNGDSMGEEKATTQTVVQTCVEAFEQVWAAAIPHVQYHPRD